MACDTQFSPGAQFCVPPAATIAGGKPELLQGPAIPVA